MAQSTSLTLLRQREPVQSAPGPFCALVSSAQDRHRSHTATGLRGPFPRYTTFALILFTASYTTHRKGETWGGGSYRAVIVTFPCIQCAQVLLKKPIRTVPVEEDIAMLAPIPSTILPDCPNSAFAIRNRECPILKGTAQAPLHIELARI
ncbi:hypothetical protein EXIGLDRAFT_314719 [Exidia glandulosa HHB12029]|uniref:Uncharacterized protein n=1 Tax=Exidia glandulosa HHB12029 TaxID=1314781 RepID=A0A165CYG9_EXIGL|nr:hypothetical protein EXIGLDRAFT_314719 [Exidia glandulosa HHB12029]